MEFFAKEAFAQLKDKNPIQLIYETQQKAVEAGHSFYGSRDEHAALNDLKEELDELIEAIEEKHSKEAIRNEMGDVLFGLINLCRTMDIPFEDVSGKLAERWLTRKALQEDKIQKAGYNRRNIPDDECTKLWKEVKQELKTKEYL